MSTIELKVSGMTCGGCVRSVQNALQALPGVSQATASVEHGNVVINYDEARILPPELRTAISNAGFEVTA